MPDRDWQKELAEIDKRISSVSTGEMTAATPAPAAPPSKRSAPALASREAAGAGPTVAGQRRHWKATVGLTLRLLVTALLLAVVVVWPYATACGAWLAAYLATIGATALGALWTSVAAWRHRAPFVHVLGLGLFLAAGVYGAMEVLPRVGYAVPDAAHPATWVCR
jgi:hypothetical protein